MSYTPKYYLPDIRLDWFVFSLYMKLLPSKEK